MRSFADKTYWIVGASEGLGRALAHEMAAAGARLILSARNRERLSELAAELGGAARVLPMDIGDSASVDQAIAGLPALDGLIFLSGVYWPVSAREWDAERVEQMLDINATGAARVIGRVLPAMVAADHGHIVLTGSLAAYGGLPGAIGYAPSKAALMSLAECMRADLRHTGIEVQLVNPGFIRTRLTNKNDFAMPQIQTPQKAARLMFRHMSTSRFSTAFPAPFAWLFRLGRFLPPAAYFRLFSRGG